MSIWGKMKVGVIIYVCTGTFSSQAIAAHLITCLTEKKCSISGTCVSNRTKHEFAIHSPLEVFLRDQSDLLPTHVAIENRVYVWGNQERTLTLQKDLDENFILVEQRSAFEQDRLRQEKLTLIFIGKCTEGWK